MGEATHTDFVSEPSGDHNQRVLDSVVVHGAKQSSPRPMLAVIFRTLMYHTITACEPVGVHIVTCAGYCWQPEYFDQRLLDLFVRIHCRGVRLEPVLVVFNVFALVYRYLHLVT